MKFKAFSIVAAAATLAAVKTTSAALFFIQFSPVGTVLNASTVPVANGSLAITAGQSYSAYVFVQVGQNGSFDDPDNGPTPTYERVTGYGVDLYSTGSALTSTANTIYNPVAAGNARWDATNAGTGSVAATMALTFSQQAVAVTKAGLNGNLASESSTAAYDASRHIYRAERIDFTVPAGASTGTANLFFQVNQFTISYGAGAAPSNAPSGQLAPVIFGVGDAYVDGAVPGTRSTVADATINITAATTAGAYATLDAAANTTPNLGTATVNGSTTTGFTLANVATAGATVGNIKIAGSLASATTNAPVLVYLDVATDSQAAALAAALTTAGDVVTAGQFNFGTGVTYDLRITYATNTESGGNLFFDFNSNGVPINNIGVVPEASSMLAFAGLPLLARRRRA